MNRQIKAFVDAAAKGQACSIWHGGFKVVFGYKSSEQVYFTVGIPGSPFWEKRVKTRDPEIRRKCALQAVYVAYRVVELLSEVKKMKPSDIEVAMLAFEL